MAKTTEELLEQALEQNSELTKQVGSLTDQIQALTEQVAYLTRKLYGSHSEKLVDPNQLSLLEDSSVFTDPEQTWEQSEEGIRRVVSKESMVVFRKCKYSVDPRYIGRTVDVELTNDERRIQIKYNGEMIRAHDITTHQFNYNEHDRMEILRSDLLKGRSDKDIEAYITEHLSQYDEV